MRRILLASENLSHWRSSSGGFSAESSLCMSGQLLAYNLPGCVRHVSSNHHKHANTRRLEGPRPRRKLRSLPTRTSTGARQTTGQGIDTVAPLSVEQLPQVEWQSPAEEAEYNARFSRILENGQPNQVMDAMVDPRSVSLLQALPQPIFVEALHLLSPEHFILPYRVRYRPLHDHIAKLGKLKTLEQIFNDFKDKLSTIVRYRTASGNALHLAEYSHLLKCAAAMGDGQLANLLWNAMRTDGVVRDGICYNHYMEAKVWDHCHTGLPSYHLRMLPRPYRKRKYGDHLSWLGYGTAGRSVRRNMLNIFDQMNKAGHPDDERSFVNILLASARVGHKVGVRNILKTVWNVDVEALKMENDNSKLPPATPYDPWSSLYPTNRLLFAVAHALGTTNDIPGSLRAVDFISSSYNIRILDEVWYEMFERIYEMVERPKRKEPDYYSGEVPRDVLRHLFEAMTSEPHNVQPTPWMCRCMVRINAWDCNWKESEAHLRKAYALLEETREKRRCARDLVFRFLRPILNDIATGTYRSDPAMLQSPQLAEAIHEYDILRTQVFVETHFVSRAAYVALTTYGWKDMPTQIWERQIRPKFMEEWKDFLPKVPKELEFLSGTASFGKSNEFYHRHWRPHPFCPVLRRTDDETLYSRVEEATLEDSKIWEHLRLEFPELDTSAAPLNRLFEFEYEDEQWVINRKKLRHVPLPLDLPPEHPLSFDNHPKGRKWARLVMAGIASPD